MLLWIWSSAQTASNRILGLVDVQSKTHFSQIGFLSLFPLLRLVKSTSFLKVKAQTLSRKTVFNDFITKHFIDRSQKYFFSSSC
jgi:uncharacterized membrane protein